jgi:hypothetical protein
VGLVDHEQADLGREAGQHLVAEPGRVEPLGGHDQQVDLAGHHPLVDLVPVVGVGRVDGLGCDAGPAGGGDLVAHERQERRHDERGPGAALAQQRGGEEVDGRLAPAGALHDEGPTAVDHQRLDRGQLVGAEDGVRPRQRPDELAGPGREVGGRGGRGGAGGGRVHAPDGPTGV